jgi:hypothetical protein
MFIFIKIYRLIPKWLASIVPALVKAGKCAEILKSNGVLTSKYQMYLIFL